MSLSGGVQCDVLSLANALFLDRQYRRALHVLRAPRDPPEAGGAGGTAKEGPSVEARSSPLRARCSPVWLRAAAPVGACGRTPLLVPPLVAVCVRLQGRAGYRLTRTGPLASLNTPALRRPLCEADARARHLAALCLAEGGEWEECLSLLGDTDDADDALLVAEDAFSPADSAASSELGGESHAGSHAHSHRAEPSLNLTALPPPGDAARGALCLLRGRVYEALENRVSAARWYSRALSADPFCYEALEALLGGQMLSERQERALLEGLPLRPQDRWLGLLYQASAKKYDGGAAGGEGSAARAIAELEAWAPEGRREGEGGAASDAVAAGQAQEQVQAHGPFASNSDVVASKADLLYSRGDYATAYELTSALLRRDPYCLATMPTHLASALELGLKNELFLRAHRLVDEYPHRAVPWFAVGCYYYCVGNFDSARRYYGKATQLEPSFAPAWLGFGNAFAAQDESDQAMAAYRSASRLFAGCHLPLVAIGMEYQRTNNQALAAQFFAQARKVCDSDPLVHNELGVLAYRSNDFAGAEEHFRRALSLVPPRQRAAWESAESNLGHALRKQRRYAEAAACYERSLALAPRCAATHAALGFTRHLQGRYMDAVEHYHKALGLRPDDVLTADMLTVALSEEGLSFRPELIAVDGAADNAAREGFAAMEVA